ncbi:MAG: lipopolysaccharide heptosyltransferase II [Acidobacteriota bacterium]|nr:lipopolysaccharide heptosyltransferase II [Acidobacteriota bacterium]
MSERKSHSERIERVVVRGANWVGDAVMTIPALRALRRVLPGAHVTLATRAWAEGIFTDADFINDVMSVDGGERYRLRARVAEIRALRKARFDLAVIFPNAFAPALAAAAARVPMRIGYATGGRRHLLTHPLAPPEWRHQRHEVFYYLNIIAELERALIGNDDETRRTVDISAPPPPLGLTVASVRQDRAREVLRHHGARLDRPLVALCPGSTNSRAKRWPSERFAALADQLIDAAGAEVVLIGAREEIDVTGQVVRGMNRRAVVLTGETSLAETVAVLSVCDLLITNDTGPAHIAAAINLPTLVIFGPTDPTTTRPFSEFAEVVREPPECAPCMLRDCPIDHRCMTAITPWDIFMRADRMLRRGVTVATAEVAR